MSADRPDLFSPVTLGSLDCKNHVAMAPLTRSRAGPGNVPSPLNALYYAQRTSAGLIISEATQIAPEGQGYISTPGIPSPQQVEGWKIVTKAVHVAGGCIVLRQAMHRELNTPGALRPDPRRLRFPWSAILTTPGTAADDSSPTWRCATSRRGR